MRPNKLIRESILAMQKHRRDGGRLRLLIAGEGGASAYTEECIALAKQDPEGIKLDIRFIPEEEVASIIAQVDAVLLPYRDFNSQSGVAVLAGMSARPVIGSNAGGLSDLYDMGLSGITIQGQPTADTIADALWRFQERPLEEWEHKARAARKALLQELGWPSIGLSYKSLMTATAPAGSMLRFWRR
jgi:glycosyltransferase involved in cell wall biosynthesis